MKYKTDVASLWANISARTDDLYLIAENFQTPFVEALKEWFQVIDLPDSALRVGPLQRSVRVYEKAHDDYSDRFPNSVILPEACVADTALPHNLPRLDLIPECTRSDKEAGKNQYPWKRHREHRNFSSKVQFSYLDPTHFRNVLVNIRLNHRGTAMFAEVQLHEQHIIDYNNKSNAHHHYEFFRSMLADAYQEKLNEQLSYLINTILIAFEDIIQVPVLLSLLTVVLGGMASGHLSMLPRGRRELYEMAIKATIKKRFPSEGTAQNVREALRKIAYANMLARRRVFTVENVVDTLGARPIFWRRGTAFFTTSTAAARPWSNLVGARLLGPRGEFQFSHLSFQEYFFIETFGLSTGIPPGFPWTTIDDKAVFFCDKFL